MVTRAKSVRAVERPQCICYTNYNSHLVSTGVEVFMISSNRHTYCYYFYCVCVFVCVLEVHTCICMDTTGQLWNQRTCQLWVHPAWNGVSRSLLCTWSLQVLKLASASHFAVEVLSALYGLWRSKLKPSHLCAKHLAYWAISPYC